MKKLKNKKRVSSLAASIKPGYVLTKYLQEALLSHPASRHLTKLSPKTKLIVRLICEDIRSHRFFSVLREIGLDDTFHQPELSPLILAYAGFTSNATENKDPGGFYFNLLDHHSKKAKADNHAIAKEAVNIYWKLMMEKKRKERSPTRKSISTR